VASAPENIFEVLAARCRAAVEPDRILDRDIEIAIQNVEGRGNDDPRDDIRAREVILSHGARPYNYEVVEFSGVSLRTPREYTNSIADALAAIPDGLILRRYVAGRLVPHTCEVSVGPDNGGWIGCSDHSMALALIEAALNARAAR